jgi:hypothetical protein
MSHGTSKPPFCREFSIRSSKELLDEVCERTRFGGRVLFMGMREEDGAPETVHVKLTLPGPARRHQGTLASTKRLRQCPDSEIPSWEGRTP